MGDEAGAKRPQLTGLLSRLSEDNITDILARLPAKSVLRCGAVCRVFRGITTDPSFLAAHAHLRPTDVVMCTKEYWPPPSETPSLIYWDEDDRFVDVELHAVPVSSDEASRQRHFIRYPDAWVLLASSDGVLLFKKGQGFYLLCNPTTRQWAQLPHLPRAEQDSRIHTDREFAFYLDTPSGEFRLLCRRSLTTNGTWCILSTGGGGAAEPRQVDMAAAESSGITQLVPSLHTKAKTHVAFRRRLYWPPHQVCAVTGRTEMLVFDMSLETFHLMAGPSTTTGTFTKLFTGVDGLLGAADFGKSASHVDLWFLGDYGTKICWELRHRVATPWAGSPGRDGRPLVHCQMKSVAAAGDGEGNVMLGNHKGLVVYNVRRKTVRTVDRSSVAKPDALMTRLVFKESLVQQPGFVPAAQSSLDLSMVKF